MSFARSITMGRDRWPRCKARGNRSPAKLIRAGTRKWPTAWLSKSRTPRSGATRFWNTSDASAKNLFHTRVDGDYAEFGISVTVCVRRSFMPQPQGRASGSVHIDLLHQPRTGVGKQKQRDTCGWSFGFSCSILNQLKSDKPV